MDSKNQYGQAYAEVLEVIKYLPEKDRSKIPKEVLNKLMGEADSNSNFTYNVSIPFANQKISQEARQILADFKRRYFSVSSKSSVSPAKNRNY